MKKYLIALLWLAGVAHADIIYWGDNGPGSRDEIKTTNPLPVQNYTTSGKVSTMHNLDCALGRIAGCIVWNKFGYNDDIDTTTDPEILAAWGGTFQYITTGETITIVSSSTADDGDPAGTGAQQITVIGVDENWNPQTVTYTLDGTTNVVSAESWIGINRVQTISSGSGRKNAGTITITATSSGYTMAQMPVGGSVTQQCIFYVPANNTFLAEWLFINSIKTAGGSSPEVQIKGFVYSAVTNTEYEVFRATDDVANENTVDVSPPIPFVIGQKQILWFTAETDTNDTAVRCRFSGNLYS